MESSVIVDGFVSTRQRAMQDRIVAGFCEMLLGSRNASSAAINRFVVTWELKSAEELNNACALVEERPF